MTDLNTQMTPEAMMQAEIERLTAERDEARAKAKQQRKVIAKVYNRVSGVVIDAVLGPDRVHLGSTNDFDLLCDLKDEWDAHKIMGEEIMTSEQEAKAYKTRAEKAERQLAELRVQMAALREALERIHDLNLTAVDENGHRWANSDLIEQEIVSSRMSDDALSTLAAAAPQEQQSAETHVVWSYEHAAWWGPDHRGYYTSLRGAGRYTREQALSICIGARGGRRYHENPTEVPILLADAEVFWPDK
ncbi:hypothetical protein D2T29_19830 [Sinirhodobacter populi]|uniref:Ead/Ea22-like family protein n=1 Tax=Paenirhodobacter populi TaxID=2306993 RepID=A0A443K236_9RHOB|nr:hypothetical protein [Sinirhodobacter populi]RWR26828.1 hypothetical protein D2T29_19830 [Sinirhodobacter populi]